MGSQWRARETVGASEQHPVELENAIRVNTGNIVPPGYDAVIMIEDAWRTGIGIPSENPQVPGSTSACRRRPCRIRDGAPVPPPYPPPRRRGPCNLNGITQLRSLRSGRAGPHRERTRPGGNPPVTRPGVDSNTVMAKAMLEHALARCTRYPFVQDDPGGSGKRYRKACRENDIVIVSAGSSAGKPGLHC